MKTDKELIREGKYMEALGDNYVHEAITLMIFKNGYYDREIEDHFVSTDDAWKYIKENKIELEPDEHFHFYNVNADWQ